MESNLLLLNDELMKSRLVANSTPKRLLTRREQSIMSWIDAGLSSKEIAEKLFISKHTVDTHRRKILAKRRASI